MQFLGWNYLPSPVIDWHALLRVFSTRLLRDLRRARIGSRKHR